MRHRKTRKQSEIVLAELRKRSKNGLEFAKKIILAEKIRYKKLHDALEHYVSNWNDMTHPGLFAIACEAVGGDLEAAVSFQAAIAMIAAAFDIHDDIIDKSTAKHGVPTVFGKFGEEVALLLGNAFLIEGFTLLGTCLEKSNQRAVEVFRIIKQSLFEFGNAHALELSLKKRTDVAPDEYLEIVKMKAASIEGDMRIGAIIGGGTPKEVETLAKYGRILGTLAMLREEFIDVFDVEELNQRMCSEYLPIPVLYAIQDEETREKIQRLLAKGKIGNKDIDTLVNMVFEARNTVELKESMSKLVTRAIRLTSNVENNKLRNQLQTFVSSTMEDL
jgi:geranylgeranyl pyrophosphate synthase